jgi:hypothetical protein
MLHVDAPADVVWAWMKEPHNLFSVNLFHASVEFDEDTLAKGSTVTIDHDFFGAYKQRRQAKIREFRENFVAFGEHKAKEVPGKDPFPHQQSFQVVPVDDKSCVIINRLSGKYIFPGAKYFGERLFKRYMPVILDDDNQVIAAGCGAIESSDVKVPKGLLLWPLMAIGGRFVKRSTRRDVLQGARSKPESNDADVPASESSVANA